MVQYETERLVFRPSNLEDKAFMLELLNTPKWLKYIGDRKVYTLDAAEAYILEKIMPQQKALGYSNYTVIRKSDQIKLGTCGIYNREGLDGVDIGFAFLPAFEGMGYAYEASARLLELAFTEFGLKQVSAITTKANIGSQKLLEKLGLQFVKFTSIPNDTEELMYYEISLDKFKRLE